MLRTLKDYAFPALVGFCALAVSGSAAFYSVTGLSKLFAGASLEVILMATTLEISKLVIAAMLHRYWSKLNKLLRIYLTSAAIVLVLITSMGIYGFLSAAYQQTAVSAGILDKQVEFLQQRETFFQEDVDRYDSELERISSNISELSKAKTQQLQVRDENVEGGFRTTISTAELRLAQARIAEEESNRSRVIPLRTQAAESLRAIQTKILEAEANNDVAAELGPLKFISELSGFPMENIVNYLLLVIIFVFDPLAISLVIAASSMFELVGKERKEEETNVTYIEIEPDPNDLPDLGELEDPVVGEHIVYTRDENIDEERELDDPLEEDYIAEDLFEELIEQETEKELDQREDKPTIVKVLQKSKDKVRILRADGKKYIITLDQYEKEVSKKK